MPIGVTRRPECAHSRRIRRQRADTCRRTRRCRDAGRRRLYFESIKMGQHDYFSLRNTAGAQAEFDDFNRVDNAADLALVTPAMPPTSRYGYRARARRSLDTARVVDS